METGTEAARRRLKQIQDALTRKKAVVSDRRARARRWEKTVCRTLNRYRDRKSMGRATLAPAREGYPPAWLRP